MIKGKPSYPFETIALSVAFSPKLEALITETKRLTDQCKAKAIFIHAGKRIAEKEKQLSSLLLKHGFNDSNCLVHWQDGNPVETILSVCKMNVVDLLIIGVLERDNPMKYFMGSVSRELTGRAKCSMMMMTDPKINPELHKVIVVNGHDHAKTLHTVNTALYFAKLASVSEIHLVDEMDIPSLSMSESEDSSENGVMQQRQGSFSGEKSRLSSLIGSLDKRNIDVKVNTISGKNGNTIIEFGQSMKADLLVVNSPDHHLAIFDRIFSNDLEYVLADLTCDMLVVHSRVFDSL